MSGALLRAQLRRTGGTVVAGPLAAGVAVALVGWLAATSWTATPATTVLHWLTQIFVLCTGVCVAVAVTGERLVELHEASPTPFRTAHTIRAGLAVGSGVAGAAVLAASLLLHDLRPFGEGWASPVAPIGTVLFVAAVAVAVAALTGTTSATTVAVVAAWLFLALLWDPYVLPLTLQRGIPTAIAVALAGFAWRRLGDPEHNLGLGAT